MAEAGLLLSRALLEKQGDARRLVLDAAMNDLPRPSLYEAWHDIVRIGDNAGRERIGYDVVGPVCETGDTFASARELPRCRAGDLVAIPAPAPTAHRWPRPTNSRPLAAGSAGRRRPLRAGPQTADVR